MSCGNWAWHAILSRECSAPSAHCTALGWIPKGAPLLPYTVPEVGVDHRSTAHATDQHCNSATRYSGVSPITSTRRTAASLSLTSAKAPPSAARTHTRGPAGTLTSTVIESFCGENA